MAGILEAALCSMQWWEEQRIGQAAALNEPKPNVIINVNTRHRFAVLHLMPVPFSLQYIRT